MTPDVIQFFAVIFIMATLLIVGIISFKLGSARRERYLRAKEAELADILVTDLKNVPELASGVRAELISGSVAVANNYFLSLCAWFINLFGGEMRGYTQLCTAARRLALVRLKEEARLLGASTVACLRYETIILQQGTQNQNRTSGVELIAYGTAIISE